MNITSFLLSYLILTSCSYPVGAGSLYSRGVSRGAQCVHVYFVFLCVFFCSNNVTPKANLESLDSLNIVNRNESEFCYPIWNWTQHTRLRVSFIKTYHPIKHNEFWCIYVKCTHQIVMMDIMCLHPNVILLK